jgi:diguanylate cyclase (GGDEF)-like protein
MERTVGRNERHGGRVRAEGSGSLRVRLLHDGPAALAVVAAGGEVVGATREAERLLRPAGTLTGRPLSEHVEAQHAERLAAFLAEAASATPDRRVYFETTTRDGSRNLELTAVNLLDDADIAGVVVQLYDVTGHVRRIEALERLASVDLLTGLAARATLRERLDAELARAGHAGEIGVLVLDLDGFKRVNDEHGHVAGDEVLRTIAHRLRGLVRDRDLVARLGGDEMVVLVSGAADLGMLAERVRAAVAAPVEVPGVDGDVHVTASIGVASSLESGTPDQVLDAADTAMYLAKSRGGNRFERYRSETTADLIEARAELAQLRADNTRLARMVRTDPLTGLLNRRAFDEQLRLLEAQFRASGSIVAILFVDVDGFRAFNKEHGHAVGDRVLEVVARCLRTFSREEDLLFRRGGEEFVVVVPGSDAPAAARVAERIRIAVESLGGIDEAVPGRVTVSIGISEFRPGAPEPLSAAVERADAAQQMAKSQGRNRVVVHPDSISSSH